MSPIIQAQLEKKWQENKEKIVSLLKDINLKTKHIDKIDTKTTRGWPNESTKLKQKS